jgi:hypothetical protein
MDTVHMVAKKFDAAAEVSEIDAYFARMEQSKAAAWMPDSKQTIRGTVIGLNMRDGGYGMYPVITYKKDDGEIINVHVFHQLLRDQLRELKTDIGSEQYITYLGKRKKNKPTEEEVKAGRDEYHDYYVENVGQDTVTGKAEDFTF